MSTKKEVKQRLISQKKEQPNPLKRSEERYQALFNSMTDMFQVLELVYDSKGKPIDCYYREVNPALERLTGKTCAQLIDKKVRDLFHFEEYWLERYHRILTTGESESFEEYGKEFDQYYRVIAWKVGKNKIASIFTDITTQKNTENSLKQAKDNQYKMLFDSMTELLQTIELTYNKEGKPLDYYIRDINTSFASFLGKTKKELINKKVSSVINRIEESWLNTFAEVENTGTAISFEGYASDFNKYFYCTAWKISKNLLGVSLTDITQQNIEKETRAGKLADAKKKLAFRKKEKEQRTNDWAVANTELAFQNKEKEKRADELALANTELAFQNKEKEKRANELALANTELAFQNKEKEKRANELALANTELAFQNEEKEKRADELAVANTELAFQNEEKEKRADELALANTELAFQNKEKEKRANELAVANTELAFQNEEKEKRANELAVANTELAFQNKEKEKRANELAVANTELAFQNEEKEKRANELAVANTELAFQNEEKEKRANELAVANTELAFQNEEKEKRANELALANTELAFQNKEKEKRADELAITKKELIYQKKLDSYRFEAERVALELTLLIDTANAPIFGIDSKGLVNEWNQTSEKITGFKKDEVLGKKLVQTYITEDYQKSVKKVLDDALLGKETANYEFPLFSKDGERVMVLLNSSTRRDANGKIIGVLGVGQDISEMDKLRTVSESIAKELRQFIETANAPIFGIDSKGLVNEWNQTSEKITGFKKEDVFGKNLIQTYITKDYRKSVNKVLDDALLGIETANYEFPLFSKDGERVMVLLNSSTRRDANGKIIGVLGVGQDISEMDKLRTVSESIAKELRQFIETANAPIFGIDSKGLVNEWNQTSEKITGFKKEDVFGKNLIQTYITEDYRESVKKVLDDALIGKETANFEFPLFTRNGHRVMVLLNSSSRRDANGKITGVIGVGQDITELAGYRNELEQKVNERTLKLNKALHKEKELNELKSKFVSTASHEFRTPLSAINFAAGSIKKYWAKMEPIMIEKKLDKIEDQVVHMTKLLDDILIVGQADAGKFKNNPKDLNFGNFIHEIIEEVYNSHNKSHEILLIDTEGLTTSHIFIDEKLGRNIFINLISNAIKFSPHAKKVHVELSSKKNHIVISIIDYGIGIYKSELKNIFQPFARGHNVDLIQGSGLGLSIAKEAIDVIGGKIIVNSTIGNGTSFIVQIPKNN
jgi:PAS domain S-box-containing protein